MELLTRNELATRWKMSIDSIDEMRKNGVIKQVPRINCIRFNLQRIEEIEETKIERFSPLERKRLQNEIEILKTRIKSYDLIVSSILKAAANIINA
jgi:hypothetical protein